MTKKINILKDLQCLPNIEMPWHIAINYKSTKMDHFKEVKYFIRAQSTKAQFLRQCSKTGKAAHPDSCITLSKIGLCGYIQFSNGHWLKKLLHTSLAATRKASKCDLQKQVLLTILHSSL